MRATTVLRPDFHVQSPAFVDPLGSLITGGDLDLLFHFSWDWINLKPNVFLLGTYDIRPLDSDIPNSKLCIWFRALECFGSEAYNVKVRNAILLLEKICSSGLLLENFWNSGIWLEKRWSSVFSSKNIGV